MKNEYLCSQHLSRVAFWKDGRKFSVQRKQEDQVIFQKTSFILKNELIFFSENSVKVFKQKKIKFVFQEDNLDTFSENRSVEGKINDRKFY